MIPEGEYKMGEKIWQEHPSLEAEGSYIQLQTHSKERVDWKGPD